MLNDFFFFLVEAINGMRRSGLMIVIAIATIAVSMFVFGLFVLMSLNVNNLADFMASKLEIRVYLKQNITKAEIIQFQSRIAAISQVKEVQFVDKNAAWDEFKKYYSHIKISELAGENPLPNALKIILEENSQISKISTYLLSFKDFVDDVVYGGIIAERIDLFSKFARYAGLMLVGLLVFATLLIVVNTIRLTVIARQVEIEIMQLVGATNQFIRWPFLFEGVLIGSIGSLITITLLNPSYVYFAKRFQESIPYFPLVYNFKMLSIVYVSLFGLGIFLGSLGAFISVSRSLKTEF